MRFIKTTSKDVKTYQNLAKKMRRKTDKKYVDCLELVVNDAGYHSWKHVLLCNKQTSSEIRKLSLLTECKRALEDERNGKQTFFGLRNHDISMTFYIFTTGEGDVWMIEPIERLTLCLMWKNEIQEFDIEETKNSFGVHWDGCFDISTSNFLNNQESFYVNTTHEKIGRRTIMSINYPIETIKGLIT